ncbi:MAG: TetR/AcrR family transcriptional regulator [Boseongicola sp.]|nr:TetR/AcrR family transcriptional regulator [Boseongicola sp.]MDD9977037.1 TetR/AcrR family transcriptional regulator [Boseongicola sp.]
MGTTKPLHRNDPTKEPLVGNVKVTRDDWLNAAMAIMVDDGVANVKVMTLADRLNVSRSSFYWYFKDRDDILTALLEHWQKTNTGSLVRHTEMPAETITEACCNVFRCFVTPELFDIALDFAVRDWARRAPAVRQSLDASDAKRLAALQAMFERFGFDPTDALVRSRTLYYMQIGYIDADLREPMQERLRLNPYYLFIFTGQHASSAELAEFRAYVEAIQTGERP